MRLTIFAASGGIGGHILEQALASGHDVTAVVRNPSKLRQRDVRIVTADLAAPVPGVLESAVKGPTLCSPVSVHDRRPRPELPGEGPTRWSRQ